MDVSSWVFVLASMFALLAIGSTWHVLHRRRIRRDVASLARAVEDERHIPPSLHPVIDPEICIGSLSCIRACPEGDVLGIVNRAAALTQPASCIGHGRCALECPVGAIKLVFGTSERGVDLPEVDENFESSRPGVFIAGELGGMGLIKNAIAQGLEAGAYAAETLSSSAGGDVEDVVVVGAGPAGIAAAIALSAGKKRVRILEQSELGGTVAHYPRQKIVMTERAQIPGYGPFGKSRMSKEDLLAGLRELVARFDLQIDERTRVTAIDGEDGDFVVHTDRGDVRGRKVILALGRRGTPRKLDVPGEELEKVTYSLTEADQYRGRRMLVVGGGDSAIEAALALARESDAEVTISYRRPAFGRCRKPNREAIDAELARGRVRALMSSEVKRIGRDSVILETEGGELELPNDFVIVCAGGELPLDFLKSSKISLRRHTGRDAVQSPSSRRRKPGHRESPELEAARARRMSLGLFALGFLIVAALAFIGWEYYPLARSERLHSPFHAALKPSGGIGHGIGVVATVVLLSNFLYALRKRWRRLEGVAPIGRWLSFHVFVGVLSPIVIAFHAAFQSNNTIAGATYLSLLIVVASGLTGRFAYGLIPSARGKALDLSELAAQLERLHAEADREAELSSNPQRLRALIRELTAVETVERPLVHLLVRLPAALIGVRLRLARARALFAGREDFAALEHTALAIAKLKTEIEFSTSLRRFLGWWRVLHVLLAVFLVAIMALHVGVALYLGYGWVVF